MRRKMPALIWRRRWGTRYSGYRALKPTCEPRGWTAVINSCPALTSKLPPNLYLWALWRESFPRVGLPGVMRHGTPGQML